MNIETLFYWTMVTVLIRYAVLAVKDIVQLLNWATTPREPVPRQVHRESKKKIGKALYIERG